MQGFWNCVAFKRFQIEEVFSTVLQSVRIKVNRFKSRRSFNGKGRKKQCVTGSIPNDSETKKTDSTFCHGVLEYGKTDAPKQIESVEEIVETKLDST